MMQKPQIKTYQIQALQYTSSTYTRPNKWKARIKYPPYRFAARDFKNKKINHTTHPLPVKMNENV